MPNHTRITLTILKNFARNKRSSLFLPVISDDGRKVLKRKHQDEGFSLIHQTTKSTNFGKSHKTSVSILQLLSDKLGCFGLGGLGTVFATFCSL
jgi:hypothetical protein